MLSQRLDWIKINNIRVFSKCTKIDFSPITIYVGPNGSGKSAANKALLLLSKYFRSAVHNPQNYDNTYWLYPEISNSKHLFPEFSNINQVKNSKIGIDKPIIFSFPFVNPSSRTQFEFECSFFSDLSNDKKGEQLLTKVRCLNDMGKEIFSIDYDSWRRGNELNFKVPVQILPYIIGDILSPKKNIFFFLGDLEKLKKKLKGKKSYIQDRIKSMEFESINYDLFDRMEFESEKTINLRVFPRNKEEDELGYELIYEIIEVYLNGLKIGLKNQIDNIRRLDFYSSSDIELKRSFSFSENVGKIMEDFEIGYTHADERKWNMVSNYIIKSFKIFEISGSLNFDYLSSDSNERKLEFIKDEISLNVIDAGSGYGKLVPMILKVACAYLSRSHFIVLEEPEINLHPKMQSFISDWLHLITTTLKLNVIVETHSEYLIRKLQFLTGKGVIDPDTTQIYYFYHPDKVPIGEEQLKKINITKRGSLTDNFGEGFFDEADNIALELFLINRSQNN